MEDGNAVNIKEEKHVTVPIKNLYANHSTTFTANGHGFHGEASGRRLSSNIDISNEEKTKKRINPLKIHLGKRPYIDDSFQYYNNSKKKAYVNKTCDTISKVITPRVAPKLLPKKFDRTICHSNSARATNHDICEDDVPVPRLLPKGQLLPFKKGKTEEGPQLKEYAHSLGLQPMVKFKCRRCCSMSFETLKMLKKHQMVCRAQAREPVSTTETPATTEMRLGEPSRVTRKVYLCSACGTCYENWNLFLHMREVHNRHICLFCLGMFSKAKRLSSHLISKHNIKEFSYESKDDFLSVYSGTLFLMCCSCEEICSEQDDIFNHDCNNVKPKPVPVLISKNATKLNANMKPISNKTNESILTNGPLATCTKDLSKEVNDNVSYDKTNIERKPETVVSSYNCVSQIEEETVKKHIDITSDSTPSNKSSLLNTYPCETKMDDSNLDNMKITSPAQDHIEGPKEEKLIITNGDDSAHAELQACDAVPMDVDLPVSPVKEENSIIQEKEKDCGIKLKLSLNNAKSPVIINSTVDPSVGKQNLNKPPSRIRRPPKRYEKEITVEDPQQQSLTPTIKMTICEKADSSFVKSTIIANESDCIKKSVNNKMEEEMSNTSLQDKKYDNTVKTTIYDNKPDEINSLNRVPKLTVRVPKELLDRDSSSDYSSDSDLSDKLTVDENNTPEKNKDKIDYKNQQQESVVHQQIQSSPDGILVEKSKLENDQDINKTEEEESLPKDDNMATDTAFTSVDKPEEPAIAEEVPAVELTLNRPLDKYPLKELLKVFLNSTVYNCIYCNHVRKIAVNCEQLALHMVAQHRFSATVDSITAEELLPETITAKVKTGAEELRSVFINLDSYDSEEKYEHFQYDHLFECFQCYFKTAIHKDLYLHNRKMHQKTILLCVMCKGNFYSYSELLCHLCPGTYDPDHEIKFRCCLCSIDSIPSSFRLMVHLRKIHHACDVCLEFCHNQNRLSNHVWKHKLHHLCYRCGIAYRNKPDITKHLFWKHGTESVMCKKCLQKKWPHVYHFCMPPLSFICDECNLHFTKAVYLKVHKRFHSKEFPHFCQEEGCTESFVSKKLLLKHLDTHKEVIHNETPTDEEKKPNNEETINDERKTPIIDLIGEKENIIAEHNEGNNNIDTENLSKKAKKKRSKDKDNLLLDVDLPALNLSESDSSDESDNGAPPIKEEKTVMKTEKEENSVPEDMNFLISKIEEKSEAVLDEKPDEQKVLDIWDNFKRYQAKVEKQKTPPLVPIRKHVCESDHDYCIIPSDLNGDDRPVSPSKKDKKSSKKKQGDLSSSSSSSSDSDSSCSCGSNCSCSSSSNSSSSSSSDSDSSDSGREKKKKIIKKKNVNRRNSCGSQASAVDVMSMAETPVLVPEVREPPIAETDLETDETETDEEFYDENPQKLTSIHNEKRNQLMVLSTPAPSDNGSISGDVSRCTTPVKDEEVPKKEKVPSSKKKSKKKRRTKNLKKTEPLKINIPKEVISKLEPELSVINPSVVPNKITISLQSNTIQIPEMPQPASTTFNISTSSTTSAESKRASKRRRIPNKFYGYSSEEDTPQIALKPQLPPKLEWRKEDLPSPPLSHKTKKEVPSSTIPQKFHNYTEPIRLKTPIPDPVPPPILMNSESMGSSDSDSSEEGALQIYQPSGPQSSIPAPPAHITSGTSSLPYPFQRPAVRQAREGESVYCYCRCPYDEVSEMIACDAEGCAIEWFHFECVGIMVPPKGKWYCPDCRQKQNFSAYR